MKPDKKNQLDICFGATEEHNKACLPDDRERSEKHAIFKITYIPNTIISPEILTTVVTVKMVPTQRCLDAKFSIGLTQESN